jgi:multiple sugar transport system permease protein
MAACVVTMLPVVIVFFLAQKQFIEGISLSGLKG